VPESNHELAQSGCREERHRIARAQRTAVFPARFMLVGAMNPCPCGFAGDPSRECRCPPQVMTRYRDRLSGPLRDRLDLTVEVPALTLDALSADAGGESTADVRARVVGFCIAECLVAEGPRLFEAQPFPCTVLHRESLMSC
jgi:hypothetical protein